MTTPKKPKRIRALLMELPITERFYLFSPPPQGYFIRRADVEALAPQMVNDFNDFIINGPKENGQDKAMAYAFRKAGMTAPKAKGRTE